MILVTDFLQQPKQRPQTAKPAKLVTDDYLRGMQQTKPEPVTKPTIARSRFDRNEPDSPEKAEMQKVCEIAGHTNKHTMQFVDTTKEREGQLRDIVLPAHTLYLIDKVVRAKASMGPIGVDNSEVINIELERELKRRNKSLYASHDPEGSEDEVGITE